MTGTHSFKNAIIEMQSQLLNFALKLTLDRDDAHDLLQDTTLKALNNESKFVDNTNFKGWMMTIMRNIFINNYRQNARKNTIVDTTEDLYHININAHDESVTPEGIYAATELSNVIRTLPEDYCRPFTMHLAGYKYEEIADKLSMPLGTVKSHIFFTRKRLRELLKDYRN